MVWWIIIQTSILSITFIALLHYLYDYFKTILTVPKVKDLVYIPAKQYKEMYKTIEEDETVQPEQPESADMKNELKEYLSNLSAKKGITPSSSRATSPVSAVSLQSTTNSTPWFSDNIQQNSFIGDEMQDNGMQDNGNDSLPTFVDMT